SGLGAHLHRVRDLRREAGRVPRGRGGRRRGSHGVEGDVDLPARAARPVTARGAAGRARPATRLLLATSMFLVAAVCAAPLAWPVGPFQPLSGSPPAPEAERSSRRVSGAPAGAPAAPVLSLRRVPAFLAGLAAGPRLQDEIHRVLADARLDPT